jgi:hypothetical protein
MCAAARILCLLLVSLVALAGGCDPTETLGPADAQDIPEGNDLGGDESSGDDPQDLPPEPGKCSFAISASEMDPYLNVAPPSTGLYDLYLWLVCAEYGLAQLQADIEISGDELVTDHFFSPSGDVVSIVWAEYGELNLAMSECPTDAILLGTLHLVGSGGGVRICLTEGEDGGALDCDSELEPHPFSCVGFASNGGRPCYKYIEGGCAPRNWIYNAFSISASNTNPNVQTGVPTEGPYMLYLWSSSLRLSALQGEIHVLGADAEFDPVFAAEPPYIGLTLEGGPDVLLASADCSSSSSLLGSILLIGNGEGVWVTLTPGAGGGIADCSKPYANHYLFDCRPFSSLGN